MSSELIQFYPEVDPRFMNTDKLSFAVKKGADSQTMRQYSTNNKTISNVSWNVKTPSLQSYMDSCLMLECQLIFDVTSKTTNEVVLSVGGTSIPANGALMSFNSFPLNRLINQCNLSVNAANLSVDYDSCIDNILRLVDKQEARNWNDSTPVEPWIFDQTVLGNNSNFGNATNSYDGFKPNASFRIDEILSKSIAGVSTPATTPTGGYIAANITPVAGHTYVGVTFCEPLFHPYCSMKYGHRAFSNVGSLDLSLILNNGYQSVILANATGTGDFVCTLAAVANANLRCTYLYAPLYMPLVSKSVSPFSEFRMVQSKIVKTTGQSGSLTSDTLSLNGIPNKVAIVLRLKHDTYINKPIVNIPISQVSVSFGKPGLLSESTTSSFQLASSAYELYLISKKNGWEGNFQQWQGFTTSGAGVASVGGVAGTVVLPTNLNTTGGVLLFDPVYDLGLPSTLTSGSSGSYDINITVTPKSPSALSGDVEYMVYVINDGLIVNSLGSSTVFNAFVTKQNAQSQDLVDEAAPRYDVSRMLVGGGLFDRITTFGKKMLQKIPAPMKDLAVGLVKEQVCGDGKMGGARMAAGFYRE